MTLPDLASRLGWLPCEECDSKGKRLSVTLPGYPDCPVCHGVGWLPSPAVLEAMEKAIDPFMVHPLETEDAARAAWEAQARLILEGEK